MYAFIGIRLGWLCLVVRVHVLLFGGHHCRACERLNCVRRMAGLLFHGVQELPAGLLAAPAGLGANAAVLMNVGMPLALVTGALARGQIGRVPRFYAQLRSVLRPNGLVLVCDHLRPIGDERPLFMSVDEHIAAPAASGLKDAKLIVEADGMAMFSATNPAP